MIGHPDFVTEPWCLRETGLDLGLLAQTESLFALSNGHIGWRANLDEGEPHGLPGSYLNGVFELRPLPYAEAGYGYPESGQIAINVTNGKPIRLLVDDEPFDVRYGELRSHERCLDFRSGLLTRRAVWVSPAGRAVRVTSTRLVSFVQRSIAAVCYEVEALSDPVRIVVQSEIIANEQLPAPSGDPRVAAALGTALVPEKNASHRARAGLVHSTRGSRLIIAAVMDHVVDGPGGTRVDAESFPDLGRTTVVATLEPGQHLRLFKAIGYGWSGSRSLPAVWDQADAALAGAMQTGWDGLCAEQRDYLDNFWARADVEIDGDTSIQQAARFALFEVLQAGARAEGRAIPAKGLTGPGYGGHTFWDTETFVLPVLTYTTPDAAAQALRWRHGTLPMAIARARQLGLKGAAFPWRTIRGEECSAYWPAGTAAFHINADVAAAVVRYVRATADVAFEQTIGLELLVHTARLWRSLGHHDGLGRFRIDGVTGPDEYSAVADNNVYTNLMAQQNLVAAADAAARHPDLSGEFGVDAEEMAGWRDAAASMFIPYDEALGVHPQAEGFTGHQVWDFSATTAGQYPLLLHFPYFDLYRKQVVKQADLVLAMQLHPDVFTREQKARNFAYYERLTVRDSSLSACVQAVIAAEVGHLDLADDYLAEAALMDLDDLEHNTADGLHVASLAGVWTALIAGYGGMRDNGAVLRFAPRLPPGLTRLAFGMLLTGRTLRVEITRTMASYTLREGTPLQILHHGQPVTVSTGEALTCAIPEPPPAGPRPVQPVGRGPKPHRPSGS
ncbi:MULTISPECIES: glycoside hydrolase family 65 protein [Arthrobacter]|uniref:Glycoside hydrolase family 65 protein n=1 Tax=Arthrobacter terricola TaxID=2547396 RepID=A0A4R5KYY4_9MICC|nr:MULTISPECIES: glycosyl hydrolase family 65 protein [Arthrobacter]MBT8159546.1 family 65 glycosyl hydrolase [Arthrobacter sp. GN70]TDG01330.1 glycoside hydrolase family 65 protein [Arthrobacter terricola]